ncbi:hypothetical protein Tco_1392124 [Tanacetum coccineum]
MSISISATAPSLSDISVGLESFRASPGRRIPVLHGQSLFTCYWARMIKMETEGSVGGLTTVNSQRLYGCQSNVVYGRSQLLNGLPPLVLRRVLEILTYLATNHSSVANLLFYFDSSLVPESLNSSYHDKKNDKGKEKVIEGGEISQPVGSEGDIPILLFVKLLKQPLFLRSIAHLEQVMGLLQVVVYTAASKFESQSHTQFPSSRSCFSTSGRFFLSSSRTKTG